MSELTGKEASTIHRLLEAGPPTRGEELVFRRDEENQLECDAVVLDECSMVDEELALDSHHIFPQDWCEKNDIKR